MTSPIPGRGRVVGEVTHVNHDGSLVLVFQGATGKFAAAFARDHVEPMADAKDKP